MRKHRGLRPCALAFSLALSAAGASLAEESSQPAVAIAAPHWAETASAVPAAPRSQVAPDAALDELAGRGTGANVTVALTEQSLSGITTGNTMNADTIGSGAISLQDSALSGFSGISNVMMNTGHNNNLQSNMSVTLIIQP